MAMGKNPRFDSRRSSPSYCSTPTVVVFVALCLVGVWMMMSSTIVPPELPETKSEIKQEVQQDDSKTFENNSRDVPVDFVKGDTNSENNRRDGSEPESSPKKETTEKAKGKSSNNSAGVESKDNQSEGKDKNTEQTSGESTSSNKDKNADQNSDKNVNNDEGKNTDENTKKKVGEEENSNGDAGQSEQSQGQLEDKAIENQEKETDQNSADKETGSQLKDSSNEVFPDGAQAELLNETSTQNGAWATQAAESKNEKELQASTVKEQIVEYHWKLCNVTAGPDYIPCLDNEVAIKKLRSTKHYEHRERHCPEEAPTCLVPLPDGYKLPIKWPQSRDKVWYSNVPHTKLAVIKGHQNWVKATGEYLIFPGGGTQFKHGALHYIDFIQETLPDIAWGKKSRVILDVGCGVASFGGYLFDRDVLTMSFAPKDEHEAQVQFALERGIPAISAVMGTKRLPFPGRVFDVVHCARCRVPWHIEGGVLLLELNRLLRPGGYFVWSATPVYQNLPEDKAIWTAMSALMKSMCWDMVTKKKDTINQVGLAIFRKPLDNKCYEKRSQNNPPLCQVSDDSDAAWNISLQACMHKLPVDSAVRGSRWPEEWPFRLEKTPYWLNNSQAGVYGKAAPEDFQADYEHWKHVVSKSYLNGLGINWSTVRNVMDMSTVYGGFAAALRDLKVWVMNVVSIDSPDTLPIIYERGLFGMYHDWCESFSSYPRSYDLLHADHLFSKLKRRCPLLPVIVEVDRILRPEGNLIVRDTVETISEVENLLKSLHWKVQLTYSKYNEGLLCVRKTMWRPTELDSST